MFVMARLSRALRIAQLLLAVLLDLIGTLRIALLPTLQDVIWQPGLLLKPRTLSRHFMGHVWVVWSPGTDENARETKIDLLRRARGVVLDIGAGHGSLAAYLKTNPDVTAYVALEPNAVMHTRLREAASQAGFSESRGNFALIPIGLEDVDGIRAQLTSTGTSKSGRVDTAVTILSLCSIPRPAETLATFSRDLLAPGGQLLWYEHVRNPQPDIAWWQDRLSPIWGGFLDQCRVGQDTLKLIKSADDWMSLEHWSKRGSFEADSFFIHSAGVAVRKA